MAKVETFLGRVWKVSRAYRFACGELWACSTCVWRTFVGQCWRHQWVRWARNRHGARNFCFAIYFTLILSRSRTIVSPHALIQSLARMFLLSLCHSLAFFLLPRFTQSLTCFLSFSLPDSLASPIPHLLARSLASTPR